jgi:NhaA family Na+:H+ antiporter
MPSHRYPLEPLLERIIYPFDRFRQGAAAGGIVLIATTLIALLWASLSGAEAVHHVWAQYLSVSVGEQFKLALSWHHWINDGLMAIFFLVVGLELKREMLVGELSSIKDAALPIFAALGGMLCPALVYLAFNHGTPMAHGWGIATATDIAFAVGVLALLSWRVPKNLVLFLTALAIADDLGAVLVIALFYTEQLNHHALLMVGGFFLGLLVLNRLGVRYWLPYALLGVLMWYAMLLSGVHATLAGVLLAITIPAKPSDTPENFERRIDQLQADFRQELQANPQDSALRNHHMATIAESVEHMAESVQSPLQRMEHSLSPWVAFLIIPIFALCNAAIDLTAVQWGEVVNHSVTLGVLLGLVLGKFVGISVFSWLAVTLGLGRLPSGVAWKHILGAAWLAGIGFTMSLFIAQLAFDDPQYIEQAKLGILLASLVASMVGLTWLYLCADRRHP